MTHFVQGRGTQELRNDWGGDGERAKMGRNGAGAEMGRNGAGAENAAVTESAAGKGGWKWAEGIENRAGGGDVLCPGRGDSPGAAKPPKTDKGRSCRQLRPPPTTFV